MKIAFLFYEGMTALDAIGPHEVLCRLPKAITLRVAKNQGQVITDSSQLSLAAEYGLHDVPHADILVVPGAGSATTLRHDPETLDWIRSLHVNTTWTVSICTGSLILGAAGILKGVKATSHWAALDRLREWEAKPVKQRVVEDGKIMTAAGVSAGIDMALTLAAKISGTEVAQTLQLGIEYDPMPPFNSGSPEKANTNLVKTLRERLEASFEK